MDRDTTRMIPFFDVYSALVYAAHAGDVRTSIVHGRVVMDDRKVVTVSVPEVRARVGGVADRIRAAVAKGIPSASS